MIPKQECQKIIQQTESYLTDMLLPFWMERSPDPEYGGFLPHFDSTGKPTGETTKSFLSQIRLLYTMSSAHRAGYGGGRCAELARMVAGFLLDHYWDPDWGGWAWIADRAGKITCWDKVGYGQCFSIYAFSEYFLATGDPRGRDAALRSYDAVARHMAEQIAHLLAKPRMATAIGQKAPGLRCFRCRRWRRRLQKRLTACRTIRA